MSDYLKVWKEQLELSGDDNGVALCESLIRERERSEQWKAAVISSGTSYDAMRRIISSYESQIRGYEAMMMKINDSPKTFRNLFLALVYATKMVASNDSKVIREQHLKMQIELAKANDDEVQFAVISRFRSEVDDAQQELPL